MKEIIKAGDKYNKLTAIKFDHRDKHGSQHWLFRCNCGNEKVICVNNVIREYTKSCGCLEKEHRFKHGLSNTKVYKIWVSMKQRCNNKNVHSYKNYGGRGIKICKRWLKFENFYEDMGERPVGKTLDKINNNGNYEPKNCRWATNIEQQNNRRNNHFLTYKGKTQTITQWARETGISYFTLKSRITRYNWSTKKALTTKIKTKK